MPFSYPDPYAKALSSYPECDNLENWACMRNEMAGIFKWKIRKVCPKHCSKVRYEGKVALEVIKENFMYQGWSYEFPTDEVDVHEEYLMFDAAGLIGSIGGTLGLFIGFSFRDIVEVIFDYLRDFRLFRHQWN